MEDSLSHVFDDTSQDSQGVPKILTLYPTEN